MNRNCIDAVGRCVLASALVLALSACEQQGPAESAGEKLDNTVEKAGEKIEKAGDDIREATTPESE